MNRFVEAPALVRDPAGIGPKDAQVVRHSFHAVEERPVYPWTEAALNKAVERAGIQPRIVDDESEEYCAMVVDSWSEYMKTIDGAEVSPEMGRELEREGEFWARRVAALKAGALRYYRIEAVKTS